MLNTDQHNPNMKDKRMKYEDFAKNVRGVNDGKDFDPDYLRAMYESIKTREIILPEEHNDRHAYDYAWKDLLVKVQSTSDLVICDTNIYDADMFEATWKPIIATLSYVFMSATDDAVFSRVVLGFDQCAQIAAKYGLSDALDRIISCLAYISTLAPDVPPSTSLNTEVQADKKSVMVSETAVRFGRDGRAQLATVVLFQVIKGNEASIREGWNHVSRKICEIFKVLTIVAHSYHGQSLRQLSNTALLLVVPKDSRSPADTPPEPSPDHRSPGAACGYGNLLRLDIVCVELRE
jgi:brefeldin A-resistance guanine nucleotide exchange factor 1